MTWQYGKIANIKQTTAKWPYELSLTSKYKNILEGVGMGRCANENGLANAFSQLEITSHRDLSTTKLGLHHSGFITFGGLRPPFTKLKLAK